MKHQRHFQIFAKIIFLILVLGLGSGSANDLAGQTQGDQTEIGQVQEDQTDTGQTQEDQSRARGDETGKADAEKPKKDPGKWKKYFGFNGYLKDMQIISFTPKQKKVFIPGKVVAQNFIHNRLNFRAYLPKGFNLGLDLRTRFFWGEAIRQQPNFADQLEQDPGLIDLSWVLVSTRAMAFHTTIDRAWINWAGKKWDFRIGRQRINWGINTVWNPNDLFNVYNFTDFDYEERPGSDAVRAQFYPTPMSAVEIAIKPSRNKDQWVAAAMGRFNIKGYDFQVLGGWFNEDIVLGGGWAGNIKNAGFKGELSYFHPRKKLDSLGVLSGSVTFDYSFKNGLYITAAALYNSRGTWEAPLLPSNVFGGVLSPKTLMPSALSLFAQGNYAFTPIISGGLAVIYAPGMNTLFLMPNLGVSIKENWDIGIFAQSYSMSVGDKFINLGNGVFIRLKWSF